MKKIVFLFIFLCVFQFVHSVHSSLGFTNVTRSRRSRRDSKGLGFFRLITYNNFRCSANNGLRIKSKEYGICYSKKKCEKEGGKAIGICAQGFGTCCAISKQCDKKNKILTIKMNSTKISVPSDYGGPCKVEFPRLKGVCQLLIEFSETELADADFSGECTQESLTIRGTVTVRDKFTLCGKLTGQHLYLTYGDSNKIILNFVRWKHSNGGKINFVVTHIKCHSVLKAPTYCLQRYTKDHGEVKSFGYPIQQQNKQFYSICVDAMYIKSHIKWKPCKKDPQPFFISGETPSTAVISGEKCVGQDFISIYGKNKYCGGKFFEITSHAKPFYLFVNFDRQELPYVQKQPFIGETLCDVNIGGTTARPGELVSHPTIGLDCKYTPEGCSCVCNKGYGGNCIGDAMNTGFCLKYETIV